MEEKTTNQAAPELLKPKARKALVDAWALGLLCQQEARVRVEELESDGRKARRILKDLEAAGYIKRPSGWTPERSDTWVAGSRAFDEVGSVQPDIIGILKDYAAKPEAMDSYSVERIQGVFWSNLTKEERKYVAEHTSEYTFVEVGPGGPTNIQPHESAFRWNNALVQDQAFRDAKADLLFAIRFEKALRDNLGWGLVQLGIISAVDKDVFKVASDAPRLHFGADRLFGFDPEKWGENASKGITTMRENIAKATRIANVLAATEEKVQAFGGWEKVLAAYKDVLREGLKKAIEKEEADQ